MTVAANRPQDSGKSKEKEKKEKSIPQTKIVVRCLPPSMTEEEFLDQISPLPDNDYIRFVSTTIYLLKPLSSCQRYHKADFSLDQYAYCTAYINFLHQDDIFIFQEKFDGYVFVDAKGNEYVAVVEFAPNQRISIVKDNKRKDPKINTIEQDPDYIKFLELLEDGPEVFCHFYPKTILIVLLQGTGNTVEQVLEEIEHKEREAKAGRGPDNQMTPLLQFMKDKKDEKMKKRV